MGSKGGILFDGPSEGQGKKRDTRLRGGRGSEKLMDPIRVTESPRTPG